MNQIPNIKDKIFVLNDYKSNRKVTGSNIYHVKTKVSDLKNIDFAIGALEYRTRKIEQGIRELRINREGTKPSSSTFAWLIVFPVISLALALLVWIMIWKKKKNTN